MNTRTLVGVLVGGAVILAAAFAVLQVDKAKGAQDEAVASMVIQQYRSIVQAQGGQRRLLALLYACGKKETALLALTSNEVMQESPRVANEVDQFVLRLHHPWLIQARYGDAALVKALTDHIWSLVNDEFKAATESAAHVLSQVSDAERLRVCEITEQRVNAS